MFNLQLSSLWFSLLSALLPSSASTSTAPSSTMVIKTIELPVNFMNASCWIIAKLSHPASPSFIMTTIILAVLSLFSLALMLIEKSVDSEGFASVCKSEESVGMSQIIPEIKLSLKKNTIIGPFDLVDGTPSNEASHVIASEPANMQIDLEQQTPIKTISLSYADGVGYVLMDQKVPRSALIIDPYLIDLELLFKEPDDDNDGSDSFLPASHASSEDKELEESETIPSKLFEVIEVPTGQAQMDDPPNEIEKPHAFRRFSYADAVGYTSMEQKFPRNSPIICPYEVDLLTDLFKEDVGFDLQYVKYASEDDRPTYVMQLILNSNYAVSIECLFAEKEKAPVAASAPIVSAPIRRMSYAEPVEFETSETAKAVIENYYACSYGITCNDAESISAIDADSIIDIEFTCDDDEVVIFTKPNYSEIQDDAVMIENDNQNLHKHPPKRRLSYAEAVGFEFMEKSFSIDSFNVFEIDGRIDKSMLDQFTAISRIQPFIFTS